MKRLAAVKINRLWGTILVLSGFGITMFIVLAAIGVPEWVQLVALVAFLSLAVLSSFYAHSGTEPTYTIQEAAEQLGVSEQRIGFLMADTVLRPQRKPGGKAWGVTVASVERQLRYGQEAKPPRRLLRFIRRTLWWMP